MSEDGKKAPPVDLAEDLNVSSDSSGSDEAVVAVTSPEAAMDQGEDIPPVGPRPEPSTATAAVEEDRPSPAVAAAAATPTFPCAECPYVGTSEGNLKTHIRRRHTDEGMMFQCVGCQQAYQRQDYLT